MPEKSNGGRPKNYTPEQVEEAVARVEARGGIADGASVKKVMVKELGVSHGIDATILDGDVKRICRVRAEERAIMLAAKLPESAKGAAIGVGNEVARAVTAVLAEQFDQLKEESQKREAEMDADLRMFRRRVQDLEAQIATHESSSAALEEKNHDLTEQLTAKDTVIADLHDQIAQLSRDTDLEGRFVEIVRGFLAGNVQKGCDTELNPSA